VSQPFKQPRQQAISSAFDATAATFERDRPLPSGVPEAIRSAIWHAAPVPAPARVLDLGAGTGRFGKVFVAAGDLYVGIDLSFPMLREFRASSGSACLAQADGKQLPFRDGFFDVVMLMQVLSGAGSWQGILNETRRVVRTPGVVVVGHTVSSPVEFDSRGNECCAAPAPTSAAPCACLAGIVCQPSTALMRGLLDCQHNAARVSGSAPHRCTLHRFAGLDSGRCLAPAGRLGENGLRLAGRCVFGGAHL